ncbi:hypothetical protein SDC9_07610 [bioreactor metagenome]|uniref:Uncharacterized protein n=1 Tax=bioreactor metagenome TaxID=1076179 RepID=A0A644T5A2_9ZZZZ|nr:hypothetical protein [Methanobrevibacter sp.]MEA4957731.1 hypothetical protein [Methanobrevibacter sp.]
MDVENLTSIGTLLTAIVAVISLIYNWHVTKKNWEFNQKTIDHNKQLLFLDLRKSEIKRAIEEARMDFKQIHVFWKDDEVNFFKLFAIQCRKYYKHLPKYIQNDIKSFLSEIIEDNNLKIDDSFLNASETINTMLESNKNSFKELYNNLDLYITYRDQFNVILKLCRKISEDDNEKIIEFCLNKSKELESYNLDKILDKEFFHDE